MKTSRTFLIGTAALILTAASDAQAAPGAKPAAGTPPATAGAKAKFSAGDANIYVAIADGIQFQLKMSERLRGKYREGAPDMLAFAAKISKESIELFTPGVDLAQAHGVEGKKIPQDMSKTDKANLTKLGTIKDDKKWEVAFFELFAKESKKNAAEAEKGAKAAQDADLKAFAEKAATMLKSQSEAIEAKFKELKARK